MKKIFLFTVLGIFATACSVDDDELNLYTVDSTYANSVACESMIAGADNSLTMTESEAAAIPSWDEVRKLYLSLLASGVSKQGTFSPSISQIIDQFQEERTGEFTTTYTVAGDNCSDSAELTVIVVEDGQNVPPCEAVDAGPDNSLTITQSEAAALPSWDEVRKLFLTLRAEGVTSRGTFSPSIDEIIARFQEEPIGDFTTTFTIGEGECTDSVNYTITVVEDPQSNPACEAVSAGPDNIITITESEAAAIPSWDEVRKLYLSLLAQGVSKQGSFDPSIDDIIAQFQGQRIGDYTTTYTIVEGECSDSVELTVRVVEDPQSVPSCGDRIDAGEDRSKTITEKGARTQGASYGGVERIFFRMLEDPGVVQGQPYSFNPSIDQLIADFGESPIGVFRTTLTIGEGECQDSVDLTLTVIP